MAWDSGSPNTSLLTTYLIRKFIPALEDELQFQKFTTKATIPQGMGQVARWNVFSSPAANVTALSPEGTLGTGTTTTNEITTLTTTGTDSTIAEYGEFIRTTRLMEYCQVPGSRQELSNRMSYGGARSIDALVRNAAVGTTTAFYAGAGSNGGSTTAAAPAGMSASAVIGAARILRDNSALGHTGVAGHPNRHFAAIMSPKSELDMVTEGTTGRMTWGQAVTQVPGSEAQLKWVNGYMGSVYGTACYRTQALTLSTVTNSSTNNLIMAEGGVGSVSIIDADPQIYVNTASAGDIGNPYRNSNTVAWHIFFATSLIDSARVVRLYSAAT